MSLADAVSLLRRSEAELRSFVAKAADAGDYDLVLRLTAWAKQLASMAASADRPMQASRDKQSSTEPSRRKAGGTEYPRFGRQDDELAKIGWSKKQRAEYKQKVPRAAVEAVVDSMHGTGKDGRIFSVADCLPVFIAKEGDEVPDYQVYIVVAWLRHLGCIDQHGRRGYSIPKNDAFRGTVESAWQVLLQI